MPHHYSSASGKPIYGGRSAPVVLPLWAQNAGAAVNKLVAIPNSSLNASTDTSVRACGIKAYGGMSVKRDTNELFSLLAGGHSDSSYNGVISFGPKGQGLMADNPQWITRCAPTTNPQPASDTPTIVNMYQADGKPTSRHVYDRIPYSLTAKRFVVLGGTSLNVSAGGSTCSDRYNIYTYDPVVDAWDAPILNSGFDGGTQGFGNAVDHVTGEIWTNGFQKYDPVAKTFSAAATTKNGPAIGIRFPMVVAHDLGYAICVMFGDGWSADNGGVLNATKVNLATGTASTLTFNASQAYTDFLADAAASGGLSFITVGMDYDDVNKRFLWYGGFSGGVLHFYWIIPNGENPWAIEHVTLAAGSISAAGVPAVASGPYGCLKYIPGLRGFVAWPLASDASYLDNQMYFLQTSQ